MQTYVLRPGVLEALRRQKGLSQGELARLSGVKQPLISKIENGLIDDVRTSTLHGLARGLDMPVADLINGPSAVASSVPCDLPLALTPATSGAGLLRLSLQVIALMQPLGLRVHEMYDSDKAVALFT